MTGTGQEDAPEVRAAVFVGTRADLGPLSPVLEAMHRAPDVDLQILTGVAYGVEELVAALPFTAETATWDGLVHALASPIRDTSVAAILTHGPKMSAAAGELLTELSPDVLVVLGDRWELLYVVPVAFLLGIPIVHLHGGEVTQGAVDERIRHAVSKLADQHCVASEDAARRLLQLGEPADRVHHTGAPGLDRLAAAVPLNDDELSGLIGMDVQRPLALFTYHPPTAQANAPVGKWASEALEATRRTCATVIATYPGLEPGRELILAALKRAADEDPRVVVVEALGKDYAGVLGAVDVVVGNSSSGVIEAATLHVPAVDVGERQRGRLRGVNVIDSAEGLEPVAAAVAHAVSPGFRQIAATGDNPYRRGDATARIVEVVRAAMHSARIKRFVDAEEGTG